MQLIPSSLEHPGGIVQRVDLQVLSYYASVVYATF